MLQTTLCFQNTKGQGTFKKEKKKSSHPDYYGQIYMELVLCPHCIFITGLGLPAAAASEDSRPLFRPLVPSRGWGGEQGVGSEPADQVLSLDPSQLSFWGISVT